MDYVTTVRPVKTQEDIDKALAASAADGNTIQVVPTHILERDGEVVGYWSVNAIPMVLAWHRADMKCRDSLNVINMLESILADRGHKEYIAPVVPGSPYDDTFPKIGLKPLGTATIFHKEI